MAKPLRLPGIEEQRLVNGLEIELVLEAGQRERWNQLVVEQHYLHNATLVGEQLRYVVSYQEQWLALLGWSAAAWHLQLQEAWLGWSEDQRRQRLRFIAQHSRFLILAERTRFPNLGTRAMKLCLDRLCADWQEQHGHPLLAVESFVDGQLLRGTIYKAANWTLLGATAGYGRVAKDFYVAHERPKQLCAQSAKSGSFRHRHAAPPSRTPPFSSDRKPRSNQPIPGFQQRRPVQTSRPYSGRDQVQILGRSLCHCF